MKLCKVLKVVFVLLFVLGIVSGCEKDPDLAIQKRIYQKPKVQADGPTRIDQTPVRLNTKLTSASVLMEPETKKNIIQNIR